MSYVLDTSVLLATGKSIFYSPQFAGKELIIPLVVVRELETKRNDFELGISARSVLRFLEGLRVIGDLNTGTKIDNGAVVRIEINHVNADLPDALRKSDTADLRILSVAKSLDSVLVTRDLPLRLIASSAGVQTQDYMPEPGSSEDHDKIIQVSIDPEDQTELFRQGKIRSDLELAANSNLIVNGNCLAVAAPSWTIKKVEDHSPCKITGLNSEQKFALEHLMNPDITIVSLGGRAGSGKTLMTLAAGIDQVNRNIYNRVVVFRSIHEVGFKDLGSLPGDIDEKFDPFTDAVFDAVEQFIPRNVIEKMIRNGQLDIQPINFVRGRTFVKTLILVDESQNLEYSSLVTLLTRVGKGSKIVLASDISQSDNLHVSKHSGISEVTRKLHGNKLFAHVHMTKSHRSETAETVASLLAI